MRKALKIIVINSRFYRNKGYSMLNENIKIDLHIHSIASKYKESAGVVDQSTPENLPVLFEKLEAEGVNLISFTDHNTFNSKLYSDAEDIISKGSYPSVKGIIAGIEFDVLLDTVKPCHILTYFDCKTKSDYETIEQVMSKHAPKDKEHKYAKDAFESILREIGLPTILVAYQRKSLDPLQKGGANSFSDACSDFLDYLEIGYISAIEIQSPNVEGIVKNNLVDMSEFSNSIGLLIGIDCHEWAVYPSHDSKNIRKDAPIFTTIRALPSFRGLLLAVTSPETRFGRINDVSYPFLETISVNGALTQLSPGVNVIIGENGSGKSTLLKLISGNDTESHVKTARKNNRIEIPALPNKSKTVLQGELFDDYNNNKDLYPDGHSLFSEINSQDFRAQITTFSNRLMEWVRKRIRAKQVLDEATNSVLTVKEEYLRKTFFVSVSTEDFAARDYSLLEKRFATLKSIVTQLQNEIEENGSAYIADELKNMHDALTLLNSALSSVEERLSSERQFSSVENIILNSIARYKASTNRASNNFDRQAENYNELKQATISKVTQQARAILDLETEYPSFPDLSKYYSQGIGYVDKRAGGYVFRSYAPYVTKEVEDIEDDFYKFLFNDGFDKTRIAGIDSEASLCNATRGTRQVDKIDETIKKNLGAFLDSLCETKQEVKRQSTSEQVIGNTFGEKALIYYEVLLDQNVTQADVLLIDQPEDNISNLRISKELSAAIQRLRDKAQIILVTHNPLLVINLDADNVIIVSGSRKEKNKFSLSLKSGCLEDEACEALEWIAENMDGGRQALARRLKTYGTRN